jgi:ribosome-associated protein
MPNDILKDRDFYSEFTFSASRSSGPGGQNVNKVNTKIELRFDINSSLLLTAEEKDILYAKLAKKISQEGMLIIISQTERSQHKNKDKAVEKFYSMIRHALITRRKRKLTRPSIASKAKRLDEKRIRSEKKALRKDMDI